MRAAQRLRKGGFYADLILNDKRLKGSLREAARVGARRAVLLLPEELDKGLVVLRDLSSGDEKRVSEDEFLAEPGRFLEG